METKYVFVPHWLWKDLLEDNLTVDDYQSPVSVYSFLHTSSSGNVLISLLGFVTDLNTYLCIFCLFCLFSVSLQASCAGRQSSFLRHPPHPDLAPAEPLCGGRVTISPSAHLHQPIHGLHPLTSQQPLHLCSVSHPGPQPCRWWIKWNIHCHTNHDAYAHVHSTDTHWAHACTCETEMSVKPSEGR